MSLLIVTRDGRVEERRYLTPSEITNMRRKMGRTQAQLAKLLGTTQPHVSDWERGARMPRKKYMEKLLRLMNYMLERDGLVKKQVD